MAKPFSQNQIASFIVTTLIWGLTTINTSTALAQNIDFDQEITIKAKRQSGDLKNKIASYIDNVTITQGSLKITADIVLIYQADKENPKYVAKGKPAIFEQTLTDGEKIILQADEIIYQPTSHSLVISGNALLQQAGSEVRGSKITYNTLTEQLEAESNQDEKVTTILKPKAKPEKKSKTDAKNNNKVNQ